MCRSLTMYDTANLAPTAITLTAVETTLVASGALVLPAAGVSTSTTVGTLSTTDANFGQSFTYAFSTSASCTGTTGNAKFTIDNTASPPTIKPSSTLSPTQTSPLTLCIQVTDNGVPTLSFTTTLSLSVNNAPTSITGVSSYDPTLSAGSTVGTLTIVGALPRITVPASLCELLSSRNVSALHRRRRDGLHGQFADVEQRQWCHHPDVVHPHGHDTQNRHHGAIRYGDALADGEG